MTTLEITASHDADVGGLHVRRALPRAGRRTIGAWCFVDHMGPAEMTPGEGVDVGPHPHTGLQTVTWLVEGEALHRDSLGSEQVIRPGQLNLMTAGNGIAHSEEGLGSRSGRVHGVQFWVAQPELTRHGSPAFEHHSELPQVEIAGAHGTVLVGAFAGETSPARRDTDHFGADLIIEPGRVVVATQPTFEHGIVVLDGAVSIDGRPVTPGHLAAFATDRSEIVIDALEPARIVVFGGIPFEARISMFWNFVARTHDEIDSAVASWQNPHDDRFGSVSSTVARIPSPRQPWRPTPTTDREDL